MHGGTNQYLKKAYGINRINAFVKHAWMSLSLIVILAVFWWLKLTGITMAGEAFCGMTEHTHDENCGMPPLICTLEETEGHVHGDTCLIKDLICELAETEGHTHGEDCYTATLICTLDEIEGHVHGDTCKELTVICELEENEEHTHGEECKKEEIICALAEVEGHTHGEECYSKDLTCEIEAVEGHVHGETCYVPGTEYGCGLTECEPHAHNEACYGPAEECQLEEHTHTTECYSDINADLETQAQWEEVFGTLVYSEEPQANIVAVAKSQLGYTESEKNFVVDENGEKNGYTRYGEWYGNPYGPWNTMFVSFCLHYAKIEDIPLSAGAETMRLEWEEAGLYIAEEDMEPWAGDLVFLDKNANGSADAVAIVTSFEEGVISVIEGDLDNTVAETTYLLDDAAVMGIGFVPIMTEMSTLEASAATLVAKTYDYTDQDLSSNDIFILYAKSGDNYYAIDHNAKAVPIYIDDKGNITADVADRNTIYWKFERTNNYENQPAYYIGNVASTKYVHPYNDGPNDNGALHTGRWESALYHQNGTGVKIRGARQDSYVQLRNDGTYNQIERNNSSNGDITIMYFGKAPSASAVWIDGTNGAQPMYTGSPNTKYTFFEGETFTLPTEWDSPSRYEYKIQGWYDVTNSVYYAPGAKVKVTGNMVFYADWVAASYDIGIYNAEAANTISSKELITTRVFDYNDLFNVMSTNAQVDFTDTGHTENWSVVSSGNVDYKNADTLNLIFIEYMNTTGKMFYPNVGNGHNKYDQNVPIREGFLTNQMLEALFSTDNCFNPETGEGIIGKTYLGTGDYLFQYASDPEHPYYGYYYYDSKLHAASYNQSDQRFYVYDYLAATSDSRGNGSYSDFLPLNSPYTNTNGKNVGTYTYEGDYGEYNGVTHYSYEVGTSSGQNNAITNLGFGTSMEVKFYLENNPGTTDAEGKYVNKDIYGKELNFEFTGDDDLWVYVDDEMVLDMGGIHGAQNGAINFSTGIVTVNGSPKGTLYDIEEGEHTLKIYYLERGGSQSNCAMYFNVAPLYGLEIQKEDVLTQEPLDGATFAVYTDQQCTKLAKLWKSEESYLAGDAQEVEFTTVNGKADIWGLVAASTYYIKETGPPEGEGYERPNGVIRFSVGKKGQVTYDAEVVDEIDSDGNLIKPSKGFTIHNVSIDEEKQEAYITVTNAQNWVQDVTTVQVSKIWEDDIDHSGDYITVYLTITDPNGTVRRIRSIVLSDENGWMYNWTNLPKFTEDGKEIIYGVAEAYEEGYYSQSTQVDKILVDKSRFEEAYTLNSGGPYYLKSDKGYLSTISESANGFKWASEEVAVNSELAKWSVIANQNNQVQLQNSVGQIITFHWQGYFYATKNYEETQSLNYITTDQGILIQAWYTYYLSKNMNQNNQTIQRTDNSSNAQVIQPMIYHKDVIEKDVQDWGYMITNTPLDEETSLEVKKTWTLNGGTVSDYQQELVTIRLLANGVDTGRTVTLTLKNGWTDTFRGLPYKDSEGNIITYTVEEVWRKTDWKVKYGPIITDSTNRIPTYSTTVENVQIPMGPELPSTGSYSRLTYTLCGGGIMLTSLITAIRLRRRKERRLK